MPMHQNPKDRALGREDGAHGKPSKCPADADAWSYRSGFIERCAARDAEIADNDLKAFEAKIAKEQEEGLKARLVSIW
jgi:hypothetical protein